MLYQWHNPLDEWEHVKLPWGVFFDVIEPAVQTKAENSRVWPSRGQIFKPLELCPFDNIRVVILSNSPYINRKHNDGLAYSSPPVGKKEQPPNTLHNVFTEYVDDLQFPRPKRWNLDPWAEKGVLLWNIIPTRDIKSPHYLIGWEEFTRQLLIQVSNNLEGVVFHLWGNFAQEFEANIDKGKHHVLKSAHPSATRGFLGTKPFSRTCELAGLNKEFWRL